MMDRMYYTEMSCGAFASCANAVFSCAHTASMQSANLNALFLDAVILASIIISALVLGFYVSVLVSLVLAAVNLLVFKRVSSPRTRAVAKLL